MNPNMNLEGRIGDPGTGDVATAPEGRAATAEPVGERLRQLFRHTLAAGDLNPLVYIVQRYRLQHRA